MKIGNNTDMGTFIKTKMVSLIGCSSRLIKTILKYRVAIGGGEYCNCIIMCRLHCIINGGDKNCFDGLGLEFY